MGEGLYIHVPFCRRRCAYCALPSTAGRLDEVAAYLDAVADEARRRLPGRTFATAFIGGGTPSILDQEQLGRLFDEVVGEAKLEAGAEFSLEANPESLRTETAALGRRRGLTRVSLGAQSFDDAECAALGRLHSPAQVDALVPELRRLGFADVSLDLLAGFPGHTMATWLRSLDRATALEPDHLSVYLYHPEGRSRFGRQLAAGRLHELDDGLQADLYDAARDLLERRGFEQYEISNFARPGHRCRHNVNYWRNGDYCGLGAGAASYEGGRRFVNVRDPARYVERSRAGRPTDGRGERLPLERRWREGLMLRLRMLDPVEPELVPPWPGERAAAEVRATLRDCARRGLVEERGAAFVLSRQGLVLANEVLARVI